MSLLNKSNNFFKINRTDPKFFNSNVYRWTFPMQMLMPDVNGALVCDKSWLFISVTVYCLTFSLTRMAEHCSGAPIILWGFHVTEFALKQTCGFSGHTAPLVWYTVILAPHLLWFLHTSQCRLTCDGVSWTSAVLHPKHPRHVQTPFTESFKMY